jgi:arylsulfatase
MAAEASWRLPGRGEQSSSEYGGKRLQAAYYAMIEMVDELVGKILDHLERSGELENTIVIFSTDHGESCGDHGLTQKGPRFFEGMVRVPLIMALPGRFRAGLKSDALVELIEIVPTLMECLGLPIPDDVQGRSLLPILTGAASPREHRDFVRTECYAAFDMPNRTFATMYRERRWKLVVYHHVGIGELYDMEADPDEYASLWDSPDHQAIKAELLLKGYDATVKAMPYGPPLVMPY